MTTNQRSRRRVACRTFAANGFRSSRAHPVWLLLTIIVGCGAPPPQSPPAVIAEPPASNGPWLRNLGTPIRDDLLGLVPNRDGATVLMGHRPNDFSGSTTAFHEEGRLSLVTFDGLNQQAWHRELNFYAWFLGGGGQSVSLGRSERFLWMAGQPVRDFNLGLGVVKQTDGYVLALDLQGTPVWQQVRSFWRDRPMRGLSGSGDRLGIRTHANETNVYEMKLDVITEGGGQLWARNVSDDEAMTGTPDFYGHLMDRQGGLLAVGGTVGNAQIDGFELAAPGVYRNPVAVLFGPEGQARWVAKPSLVSGNPVGSFFQAELRPDGSFLLLSTFDDAGSLQFGDDVVEISGWGATLVSILSPDGNFVWTRAVPNIWSAYPAGSAIYLVEHTYERLGEQAPPCRRSRLLRLNMDGTTSPLFVPQDIPCVQQPDWRADIQVQSLENGRLAVAGQFRGQVRHRSLVVSNEGRLDEDVYYAIVDPSTEGDSRSGEP